MREIPAKCGYCGYLFPSGYGFDPGGTGVETSMKGWENAPVSTPCPMCRKRKGRVLEGEFRFAKDAITLLSGPDSTVDDLERLAAFLRDAQGGDATADEIQERAKSVGLSTLIDKLLAGRPARMELQGWLTLLTTVIVPLVIAYISGGSEKPEPSQAIYINYGYQYSVTVQPPRRPWVRRSRRPSSG
jgi:rubredoxin